MPREIPITFTPELIEAILDGRKTMTRRLVKPQPQSTEMCPVRVCVDPAAPSGYSFFSDMIGTILLKNPHGVEGDLLWVREQLVQYGGQPGQAAYHRDGRVVMPRLAWRWQKSWLSPIHMPKEAARLWLRRTDSRPPERLQEITEEDAVAEGCRGSIEPVHLKYSKRYNFQVLWDSIHSKPGTRWADNPWVWPDGFERIEREHGS